MIKFLHYLVIILLAIAIATDVATAVGDLLEIIKTNICLSLKMWLWGCIHCPLWMSLMWSALIHTLKLTIAFSFVKKPHQHFHHVTFHIAPPFNTTSHVRSTIYFQVAHSYFVYGKWLCWPFWLHRAHIMVVLLKTPLKNHHFERKTGLPAARWFNASQKYKRMCTKVCAMTMVADFSVC